MAYQSRQELLDKAISHLRANPGKKIMPVELASAIDTSPLTSKNLCKYLHGKSTIIRFGRGYTWNLVGAAASGPIPAIFPGILCMVTTQVKEEIRQLKLHNKLIGRAYFNGKSDSPLPGRKQTMTLEKTLRDLQHLKLYPDSGAMLVVLGELSKDIPNWPRRIFRRTKEEAEQVEADARQEAIDA